MSGLTSDILVRIGGILNRNAKQFGKSVERISTGQKINRPADDPASFVVAEQLRSDVKAIDQAIKNNEADITLLQTADSAMDSISSLLHYLKQDALSSANAYRSDPYQQKLNHEDSKIIISSINQMVKEAKFGGKQLLDGSAGALGTATGPYLDFISAGNATAPTPDKGVRVDVTQRGSQSYFIANKILDPSIIIPNTKVTAIEDGKTASYTINKDDTPETIVINLQKAIDSVGLRLIVDRNPAGRLLVYHKEYGSKYKFQVSSNTVGLLSDSANEIMESVPGADAIAMIDDIVLKGDGQMLYGVPGTKTDGLILRYSYDQKDLSNLTPADETAGYYKINQNTLYFQNYYTKDGGFYFGLNSLYSNNLGKTSNNLEGYRSLDDIDLSTEKKANASVAVIDSAIEQVLAQRNRVASVQKRRLENTLDYLVNVRENILAGISAITDVDYADEVIKSVKSQINTTTAAYSLGRATNLHDAVVKLIIDNNRTR